MKPKQSAAAPPSSKPKDPMCVNCGRFQSEHYLVNYADGAHVGAAQLICPVLCFEALDVPVARTENPPHGPVSERFMRHHYGAKR